jgi:outer membrane protein OmpA-like peptidoglycan-associated protein
MMERLWTVLILAAGVVSQQACASKPQAPVEVVRAPRTPSPEDLIVLLRDGDGAVGGVAVSNELGTTDLGTPGASTQVSVSQPPSPSAPMTDDEIQRIFGEALSSLPPPPHRFTLHFRFESEELTAESRARVLEIVAAVQNYPAAEVMVIGHTDTTGASFRNFELGLRRAESVRDILIAASVHASSIDVTSHGEADPVVRTRDEVVEPRNRRVDITVR